ncbi:3'(2'),5'-bisphosphate nucleotidase 1-like [Asterias rubens]|uniref:3'(2'),5'-bisphosphate nucleotidase 1-like n=1 Tax=Asterias rubens TaxID=7604 RepID=UPI0014550B5E|nr:3'(2'),5'-bisphosphate nucleotidase 1-like [Asterias rubens]
MAASSATPLIVRLVSASVAIANRAGSIIRKIMKDGSLNIVQKGGEGIFDPQTEADRRAQYCIVASLVTRFPGITVIGEEELEKERIEDRQVEMGESEEVLGVQCPAQYQDIDLKDVVVWVDPVDGTTEYTQGFLDHVTVLIGVAVKGIAVAGVIHQPYFNYKEKPVIEQGRTMWGILGLGGFGFEHKDLPQRVITTTRSHLTEDVQKTIDAMKPDEILRVGGAGHKVILLLEGRASAYIFASRGCKKWDTCAPEAILHAVGGKLTDCHNHSYQYHKDVEHQNTGGVIAAFNNHQFYIERVPESIRDKLPTQVPSE